MAEVIRMPLLSDTMTEGKIVAWNKKVGDKVKADDVLADVETDKATMEVNGYVDGILLYIGVPEGEAAKINQIIAIVGKEGEDYKSLLDGETSKKELTKDNGEQAAEEKPATTTPQPATPQPATPQPATSKPQPITVTLPEGAKEIRMPLLSDTMTEGKIVAWNKKVGDVVKADDVLADVETDKATMEVVGYEEGTLLYIGVEAGQAAKINQIIAIVGKPGTDVAAYVAAEKNQTQTSGQQTIETEKQNTENQPQKTENVQQSIVAQPVIANSTPVTTGIEPASNADGRIKASPLAKKIAAEKGLDISKINGTGDGGRITKSDIEGYKEQTTDNRPQTTVAQSATPNPQLSTTNPEPVTPNPQPATNKDVRIKASPLAKKIAAEKGLDISKISGTGDGGRITKSDIEGYKEQTTDNRPQTTDDKQKTIAQPATSNFQPGTESYTDVPLTQMRKVIARRLGESMFTAPHFYLTMELNMDNAMAARIAINEISPVKVSFNDMIIKACAAALRLHPDVNSSWMGDFIRKNKHIHIGSALALPEGLIVPVIKFADQKSLSQIAADAKELYAKAKDKKLQPNEFSGNTFTISNLGMMDIEEFTAIINPPDSCILAVGKIKETVVSRNGKFETANIMKVTLSCDHRSVDGAVGAAFLQTLKKFVENPVTMLV